MNTIITVLCILFSSIAHSQQLQTDSIAVVNSGTQTWQLYYENSDLKIEYKYTTCDPEYGYDQELIVFRLSNLTAQKIGLSWLMAQYFQDECKTCDYPQEYTFDHELDANEVIEGNCAMTSDHQLKIFSKFKAPNSAKGGQLQAFRFDNLNYTLLEKE